MIENETRENNILCIAGTDALLDTLRKFVPRKTRSKSALYSDDQISGMKDFASRYPVRSPYGSVLRLAASLGIGQKSANLAIGRLRRGESPDYWDACC
jgi:hypothetical protein